MNRSIILTPILSIKVHWFLLYTLEHILRRSYIIYIEFVRRTITKGILSGTDQLE